MRRFRAYNLEFSRVSATQNFPCLKRYRPYVLFTSQTNSQVTVMSSREQTFSWTYSQIPHAKTEYIGLFFREIWIF